jgi:DNA-binding transcriptional regulator YdaS (Cro superfamily)
MLLTAMRPNELFKEAGVVAIEVARKLGITPGAISQWDRVPAERVPAVEKATGIPRHKLRPDLYNEEVTSQ